jgi:outer membrane protein OmpA-like peptidoglycan-associated protein
MNRSKSIFRQLLPALALGAFFASSFSPASAQEPNPTAQDKIDAGMTRNGDIFFYKVNVVRRDIDAVNYLHRSASTKLNFKGTPLLPNAHGEADVKSERGEITIDAKFDGLTPANGFGPEYLTYVLWAITPDGRPNNLGEILPAGTKNNIKVTTSLQAFGLIITAEPYFAVATPSDVVVMENHIIEDKTNGVLEHVNAHYVLLPRGNYADTDGAHTVDHPITRDEHSPLELYEAYNALRIATKVGAAQYAPDILAKAQESLKNASDIDSNKHGDRKLEITFARGSVQTSEDAYVATLRKEADARQQAALDAKNQAELQAQQSQLQAQQAQLAAAQAQAAKAKADAEAAEARARAAQANKAADNANAIREKLRQQLNSVLATSETARGLIVNMSDVLFDTGKFTLKPDTKIALAKVAGILQAYPGLKLQVEGYTDSVGGDDYNQKLSENRAGAVKDFLVSQGVSDSNITAAGYGKASPVADNTTAAGRAQNRRVNLVVSGDAIGISTSAPTAN